ncbi:MAG TPA: AraC family transcriptional regulator [Planctomycetota bacterium]|nr:AraC family transcriptional regulator [Planctomycetota bacterium]
MAKRAARRLPLPMGGGATGIAYHGDGGLPQVCTLGLVQVGPRWRQVPHEHDFHELHYLRRGSGELHLPTGTVRTLPGWVYVFGPNESHGGASNKDDPAQILYMGVRFPHALYPALAELSGSRLGLSAGDDVADFRNAMKALSDALAVRASADGSFVALPELSPLLRARVLAVLAALMQLLEAPAASTGTARQRELAEALLRELELSKGLPPSLDQLARKLDVSPRYLGEALGAATGQTYPEALAAVRVRNAQALLADASIPIREVAQRVGLSSPRALARLFRRVTSLPPSAFRA